MRPSTRDLAKSNAPQSELFSAAVKRAARTSCAALQEASTTQVLKSFARAHRCACRRSCFLVWLSHHMYTAMLATTMPMPTSPCHVVNSEKISMPAS